MWMLASWWISGGLLIFYWLSKFWEKLDDSTKKSIVEAAIKTFEEILRAFYRWWKQKKDAGSQEGIKL